MLSFIKFENLREIIFRNKHGFPLAQSNCKLTFLSYPAFFFLLSYFFVVSQGEDGQEVSFSLHIFFKNEKFVL